MAASSSVPIDEAQAPPMTADSRPVIYLGIPCHGGFHFQNGVAPAYVHAGSYQLAGTPVDVSSLVARIGMPPSSGFEMPYGAFAATGFGAVGGVPAEEVVAMAPQPLIESDGGKPPAPVKASWTEEEDSILREMVEQHGEKKWSVIAQCLPGRIGKQCRERWINHLRPDIKQNDIWAEEDDKMLIDAHRYYGNRWSLIARYLPGRSENSVKNHWNATLRSLKAKRRLKKKKSEQAPPGQLSVLEEYIRNLHQKDTVPKAPPPPSSTPRHHLVYNGLINPVVHAPLSYTAVPTHREMSFNSNNSIGSSNLGMINLNMPPILPDLNAVGDQQDYYMNYAMYVPPPSLHLQLAPTQEDPWQAYSSSLNLFPYADYFSLLRADLGTYHDGASSSNPGANCYYTETGCNITDGRGDQSGCSDDVVEPASRESLKPSNDEVTLELSRFK